MSAIMSAIKICSKHPVIPGRERFSPLPLWERGK
jgi:hypothetical protein